MIRATLACLAFAAPAFADGHVGPRLTGTMVNTSGANIGSVSVFETESGIVRVVVAARGLEPGAHSIHLHATGLCEGDFSSAGGHIAGDAQHGLVAGGPHPGDLPNGFVEVEALNYEAFNERIAVDRDLMDGDGSALIVHSGPDDYESQPAGDAGHPVACAVLGEP